MADIDISKNNKGKSSIRMSLHFRSTKFDLTPMVDLGFLLITFFVFTTSISQPTAMNLIEPKNGIAMPVKESGVMTFILGKEHQLYYYYGMLSTLPSVDQIKRINFKDARFLISKKKKETAADELMYIIKSDGNSTFGDNIDIVDEMTICNVPSGHYSEIDITNDEKALIKSLESM